MSEKSLLRNQMLAEMQKPSVIQYAFDWGSPGTKVMSETELSVFYYWTVVFGLGFHRLLPIRYAYLKICNPSW
tara:strand:+ start:639 stop:857 length:219 start_codon:yes stop_codon:yes gene_type:complete